MAGLDDLWGATLEDVRLDPTALAVDVDLQVVLDGVRTRHNLKLLGISEFQLTNAISLPWAYAELTEIRAIALPRNRVRVEMILWSEDGRMTIEADSLELDGTRVEPDVGGP
ncbi:MAG TPA: hypothetical protein VG426_10735 [Candidatus Dormibacteraeota bacterium]|jgi:hypothetical protein|nr:hypothetical protein [Candidatus Dormibacteraeota bacterium]